VNTLREVILARRKCAPIPVAAVDASVDRETEDEGLPAVVSAIWLRRGFWGAGVSSTLPQRSSPVARVIPGQRLSAADWKLAGQIGRAIRLCHATPC
jgi:hypothetical protein